MSSTARRWVISTVALGGALAATLLFPRAVEPQEHAVASFALVELFTSEGCSSCPPADALLAEIAGGGRAHVFALAFHVDYWNHLGWVDRFSEPAFAARQRDYARALTAGVYTPQMVVNGKVEFVGSDRARAGRAIEAALERPARVAISIEVAVEEGGGLSVRYKVAGAPRDASVSAALVEAAVESDVARGENAGRRLEHANVVRAFETRKVEAEGRVVLVSRVPVAPARASVVAFVQDPSTLEILGAAGAAIPALERK